MAEKMSGKKTALELAQARKSGKKGAAFDIRQLLLGAVALSCLLGLGLLFQAYQLGYEDYQQNQVREAGVRATASLAQVINELDSRLRATLENEQVMRAARNLDDSSRSLAEVAIREQLPELISVEFYPADAEQVLDRDLAAFGYAKVQMLVTAIQRAEDSEFQVHGPNADSRYLARAYVVESSAGGLVGVAYVVLPVQPLIDSFKKVSAGGGYLDLRQRGGRGGDLVFSTLNTSTIPLHEDLLEFPVAGSLFRVHGGAHERFLPLPVDSALNALVLGVLLLLIGAALIVLRVNWERVRGSAKVTAEPTLASLSQDLGNGTAAVAASNGAEATSPAHSDTAPAADSKAARPSGKAKKAASADAGSDTVDRSIFRSYDIRGEVGSLLNAGVARQVGRAVGSLASEQRLNEFVVGRDARDSSEELAEALIEGLRAAGCDVIDVGMVTTPMVYFACFHLNTGCGVMVTGSHNPPEYNGFKIVVGGQALVEEQIHDLYARISEGRYNEGQGGVQSMDIADDYNNRISGDVQLELPLKVVVDCGNAAPGAIAPAVLAAIGCEVEPLYCDIDSRFPNHHPDPAVPANLLDLALVVKQVGADVGVAFDGDGDRLGVVTGSGQIVANDRLLMLFAIDLLSRNPGASVIYDVKCSSHLSNVVLSHGGSPLMWKSGHSLVKSRMSETGAQLAGELTGHFFFAERWYGFDDGIYAACRLLEIIAADGRTLDELIEELPGGIATAEMSVPMAEGAAFEFMERFTEKAELGNARITNIDGIRADYPDGWGLVRSSNTTSKLSLRFEGDDEAALDRIQETFRTQLLAVDPKLKLPF